MDALKQRWQRVPKAVRKPLVFMAGTVIIIIGLILLPLPGPGGLIIFLGLAILATEFVVAEKARDWVMIKVKQAFAKIRRGTPRPKPKTKLKP
ncbi:MAG: TIGR02611 family protein [Candidatus Saccharimonadales bacterium]